MSIKWIKITTAMFDDEKIKLIRNLPEADSILLTWIQLLVQAGKANASGSIILNERIPYTEEMLATIFDRSINVIRLALRTFEQFGMIHMENGVITISNWDKHQNVDGMDKIRELNRQRVARHREKQKQLPNNCNGTGNVTVTHGNALDIDIDKELDIEKEIDINNNVTSVPTSKIPYKEIVEYLNVKAGTSYKFTGKKTQSLIRARWNEGFTLEDFKKVIDNKVDDANDSTNLFDAQYLRPETLFSNKFEGYLNQRRRQNAGSTGLDSKREQQYRKVGRIE
ncbi:phage replisome organizer N-terminal domain-containing protein [Brevibacillus sp. AG]|uniref:phage replisome organizer N-terminal domain-containing protein n=1 Tax=Brevibacillus sp. AG TaxID=3020891 RepID=UPI00232EFC07|nr:phage replisome organizer N-terminal domain-containing protein [Brevibacillus sp. AG]MDC0763455.1 phage replisome organizer N-terminal domain-containing protein [Brevibacillus sp. AG]